MSQETGLWLNRNTLIGFTDKRGHAWHYRASEQGDEPNHYPGAVPVADVKRRLFGWEAQSRPLYTFVPAGEGEVADGLAEDGSPMRLIAVPGRQAITREDGDEPAILGIFADGYTRHQYAEWLVDTVSAILDDGLAIGSAGLLKRGGVAWVSVEVPETITTPEGVPFRPNLIAATSHDGSLATTYQRVVTNVVCDNTMSAALAEKDQRIKIRHSRYSKLRLAEARDALAIVHTIADDFAAEVAALSQVKVPPHLWRSFVDAWAPLPEDGKAGRALTLAEQKREGITKLWTHDSRVSPWAGTAWGVVQAVNTWTHHEQTVRGAGRAERNMLRAVEGGVDTLDGGTLATLQRVLAAAA